MDEVKILENYLILNAEILGPELIDKFKKLAQTQKKLIVLTKKAFVLFFWQQLKEGKISQMDFLYAGDYSLANDAIWERGFGLEGSYRIWGDFLGEKLQKDAIYVVDSLSLKLFADKHPALYSTITKKLQSQNSQIVGI